jgi:hypothetical protein
MIKLDYKTWNTTWWLVADSIKKMEALGIAFGDTVLIECANNTDAGVFGNGEFIPAIVCRGVPVTRSTFQTLIRGVDDSYPIFEALDGRNYLYTDPYVFEPVLPAYMRKIKG